jgi:hypothetical protein
MRSFRHKKTAYSRSKPGERETAHIALGRSATAPPADAVLTPSLWPSVQPRLSPALSPALWPSLSLSVGVPLSVSLCGVSPSCARARGQRCLQANSL